MDLWSYRGIETRRKERRNGGEGWKKEWRDE